MYKKNKVKSLLLLMILYFSASLISKAQDTTKVSKETQKPLKWEIATDLLWLIDKNTLPKYTLFGRYHYKTKSGKDRAIRLRIGGYHNEYANRRQETNSLIRLGYEWRKQINKFVLNYGLDLSMLYYRELDDVSENNIFIGKEGFRHTNTQILGFVGVTYFIVSNLSISTECSLNIGYQYVKSLTYYQSLNGQITSGLDVNGYNINTNPFYVFNLSYHF